MNKGQLNINNVNKKRIIAGLRSLENNCIDKEIRDRLTKLIGNAEEWGETDSKTVLEVDADIFKYIEELQNLVVKTARNQASVKVGYLEAAMTTRSKYGQLSKTYMSKQDIKMSRKADKALDKAIRARKKQEKKQQVEISVRNMLEELIAEGNDKIEEYRVRYSELMGSLNTARSDSERNSILQQIHILVNIDKKQVEEDVAYYNQQLASAAEMKRMADQARNAQKVRNALPSKGEMRTAIENYKTEQQQRIEDTNMAAEIHAAFSSQSVSYMAANSNGAIPAFDAPNTYNSGSATNLDFDSTTKFGSATTSGFGGYSNFTQSGRNSEQDVDALKDLAKEVGKNIKTLDNQLDKLNDGEFQEIISNLESLLLERREKTVDDKILDSKIDDLCLQYGDISAKIESRINMKSYLGQYRQILSRAVDQSELSVFDIQNKIRETLGNRFPDIESIALSVSENTAARNKMLEDAVAARVTAMSEEINKSFMSEIDLHQYNSDMAGKDVDKYASIETKLGLRKAVN